MLGHFAVVPIVILVALVAARVFKHHPGIAAYRKPLLPLAMVLLAVTATLPHIGQRLYDLGLSMRLIDLVEIGSLYVFVFALSAVWHLLPGDRRRWFLAVLVPVAFLEWLKWTFAFLVWGLGGFRP